MKHYYYFFLILFASINAAQSDWFFLDDMESPLLDQWTLTESAEGTGSLVQMRKNPGGCGLLYLRTGAQGYTSATLTLQKPIPDGESGTIYLRYFETGNSREYFYGFSDKPINPDGNGGYTSPKTYSDFEGMIRMDNNSSLLEVRDGSSYRPLTGDNGMSKAQIDPDTWYELWIIIDNEIGSVNDTYSVYIKGGAYTTQTLLKVIYNSGNEENPNWPYYDEIFFRHGTTDPITNFLIMNLREDSEGPNNGDPVYLDMIAQAPGRELTNPLPFYHSYCDAPHYPYAADSDGNAYVGDWLGWVNLKLNPWIYAYNLDSWLWVGLSETSDHGIWAYIRK